MVKKLVCLILLLIVGISSGAEATEKDDATLRSESNSALEKEDYGSAAKLLTILHQRGDTEATYTLAQLYLQGAGVPQDSDKGISMLRKLAEGSGWGWQNSVNLTLGQIYETGTGVNENLEEAANYYWKVAGEGVVEGSLGIGRIYKGEKGISMLSSALIKAEKNYDKKMQKSCGFALGLIYEQGYGTAVDQLKAVNYYWKAASSGAPEAVAELARIYQEGKVVSGDWKEVYVFACKLKGRAFKAYEDLCAVAKDHMTGAQIREAEGEINRREEARGAAAAQQLYYQMMAE